MYIYIEDYSPCVNCKLSVPLPDQRATTAAMPCSRGLQMSKLVICPTCEKLRHRQRPRSCSPFVLLFIGLRRWAVNPTIDQLPDRAVLLFSDISMSLAPFLFWTISHLFRVVVGNVFLGGHRRRYCHTAVVRRLAVLSFLVVTTLAEASKQNMAVFFRR